MVKRATLLFGWGLKGFIIFDFFKYSFDMSMIQAHQLMY